jgi:hypothetical protein
MSRVAKSNFWKSGVFLTKIRSLAGDFTQKIRRKSRRLFFQVEETLYGFFLIENSNFSS